MISDYGPGAFVIVCPPGGNLKKRAISIDTLLVSVIAFALAYNLANFLHSRTRWRSGR